MSKYRVSFEIVSALGPGAKYYNAALNEPICDPSQVPDEYWTKVTNAGDKPWTQFENLKKWEKTGKQLVRNVKLYEISEKVTEITANKSPEQQSTIVNRQSSMES